MSTMIIFDALKMTSLALVSVGLWTLRVALTAKGRRLTGAAIAAVEASVFALVFASLVSDLDRPGRIIGYALGVAMGTLIGMSLDKHLSRGQSALRIVVPGSGALLLDALRGRGWPATGLPASGLQGQATMLMIAVDNNCLDSLMEDVRRLAPDVFWTVERLHLASVRSASRGRCRHVPLVKMP